MRWLCLLLLTTVPAAGAQTTLVDDVTAWDAELHGEFGGLVLTGHDNLMLHVDAERLVVHVYESTRVRLAAYSHWMPPSTTTTLHTDATLTARSFGGLLVVLDVDATFQATGPQIHVTVPTQREIMDRNVTGDPIDRSTLQDLVVHDEAFLEVRGDFVFGVDQYLVHVDDGERHVYDARTDNPRHAGEVDQDARHVVIEAENATLRIAVPATTAGGLFFPRAELHGERIAGLGDVVGQVLVERQGDAVAATIHEPANLAPETAAVASAAPPWPVGVQVVLVGAFVALAAVLGVLRRSVDAWVERADDELRRGHLTHAVLLARVAQLRHRGSPDAASLLGQIQDRRGRLHASYRAHARAAHLYEHPEDRGHSAFDAAVTAAALGWGRRSADMLVRAIEAWPDVAHRNLATEPAFNLVLEDPAFQKGVGHHFAV